jgi:hypothetical protein
MFIIPSQMRAPCNFFGPGKPGLFYTHTNIGNSKFYLTKVYTPQSC